MLADGLQGGDHRLLLPHRVRLADQVDGKAGAADADEQPEEVGQGGELGIGDIVDLKRNRLGTSN